MVSFPRDDTYTLILHNRIKGVKVLYDMRCDLSMRIALTSSYGVYTIVGHAFGDGINNMLEYSQDD